MADPRGFLRFERRGPQRRPVPVRLRDWREVYEPFPATELHDQAARCMDCGIPFCHEGCPLANLIPEWNDLVWRGRFEEAAEKLHATNNFPEFTGRLCPAPCEGSCVLGIDDDPVAIKQVELEIAERSFAGPSGGPHRSEERTGKRVAIAGSGPAGLAAAQQLARAGHDVVVFERAERAGGLLRYGIPEFKMEKAVLDRRLAQLEAEGVQLRLLTSVGSPAEAPRHDEPPGAAGPGAETVPARGLLAEFDALVLAGGSTRPRELAVPGRDLRGVYTAMEFLKPANLVCEGVLEAPPISAAGKRVVIVGGGDTGADCLGTVHRHGAVSVHQLEIMAAPPSTRAFDNPWPTWPLVFRISSAHEEGGDRLYGVNATGLADDGAGAVRALVGEEVEQVVEDGRLRFVPVPGSGFEIECDLVLLALGFVGAERGGAVGELGLEVVPSGAVGRDRDFMTSEPGVFVCGDMGRGQSLVVWAIAEGRSTASAVDRFLMGATDLPAPITPGQLAIR